METKKTAEKAFIIIAHICIITGLFFIFVNLKVDNITYEKQELKSLKNDSILRDSLNDQVIQINYWYRVAVELCKTPPIESTKKYKQSKLKSK